MGGENPQFNQVEPENSQAETHLALLRDAFLVGAVIDLQAPVAANNIKTFEDMPRDKMLPKDIPDPYHPGKTIKGYSPANPPESPYKINKDEIQQIQPGLYAWQTNGQVNANTNYRTTYYWKDGAEPRELSLQQVETTYTNAVPEARPLGLDIPFVGLKDTTVPNVRIDIRKPTHDRARDGYECEIASYPIATVSTKPGQKPECSVYVVNSFADKDGVKQKTVENVYGKNYEYLYRTRTLHYEKLAADGQTPVGLLSDTLYGDPDGGTTKKLRETIYLDDKGKPQADGQYALTTIYDITQPAGTILATLKYKPVIDPASSKPVIDSATGKAKQIITETVDYNYHGTRGAKLVQTFYDNGQRKTWVFKRSNGINAYVKQYSADGKIMTLDLYGTVTLNPNEPDGDATIIFQRDNKGVYQPVSGTVRKSDGTEGVMKDSKGNKVGTLNKEELEKLMQEIKNGRR